MHSRPKNLSTYFYSGSEVVSELTDGVWTDYIFFNGARIAMQRAATTYLHTDHLEIGAPDQQRRRRGPVGAARCSVCAPVPSADPLDLGGSVVGRPGAFQVEGALV